VFRWAIIGLPQLSEPRNHGCRGRELIVVYVNRIRRARVDARFIFLRKPSVTRGRCSSDDVERAEKEDPSWTADCRPL